MPENLERRPFHTAEGVFRGIQINLALQESVMKALSPSLQAAKSWMQPRANGRLSKRLRSAVLAIPTLCLAAVLTACNPSGDLQPLPEAQKTTYTLGVGDKVRVITFGNEALTGEFRVNDAGKIAVPLLGSVPAAGLTPEKLQANIAGELESRNLLHKPNVSVEITEYRPVFVLGEVNRPGEYPYKPGMTVLSAVSTAGGFTYRAVTDEASIVRTTEGTTTEGTVTRRSLVQPGDVITIFERHF
jgi:polysaccharide export outer membrane protein